MRLPTPVLIGLLTAAFVTLIGLGVWQIQRNDWKQGLVAESHAKTDALPVEVVDSDAQPPDEIEYRRVRITGTWLLDDTMFLANRARESVLGEEIIVPVRPETGPAILVNMGWIPTGARDEIMGELANAAGTPVEGLALDASGRNGHVIPSGSWSGLDPEAMSASLGYDVVSWFVLAGPERDGQPHPSEDLPVQGWQRFQNTTPHVEYALTWFGIAAVLVVAAVVRLIIVPRRERRDATTDDPPRPR